MRRYALALVMVALVFTARNAQAVNWQEVGKTPAMTTYADVDSARAENGYQLIWTLTAYDKVQSVEGKQFQSVKMLHYIDCGKQEIATKASVLYPSADGHGVPVINHDFKRLTFKPEPPGSIGDLLIKRQCK